MSSYALNVELYIHLVTQNFRTFYLRNKLRFRVLNIVHRWSYQWCISCVYMSHHFER